MVVTWTYIQYVLILLKLKRKNEWGKEDKRKEWASWSEFHLKKGQTVKSKASSPTTSTLSHFSEAGLFGEVAMCWEVGQTLLHAREQVWRSALCTGTLLTSYVPTGIIWGKLFAEENNPHFFLLWTFEIISPPELFGSFFTVKKNSCTPRCPFKAQIGLHAESQHFQVV